jgi:cob(I)alamin adenosyltransferase
MTTTTKTGDSGISFWPAYAKATAGKKGSMMGVSKDNILIETVGTLDEVQAMISITNYELRITNLDEIATDLYAIMGEIAYEKKYEKLEERIDLMEHTIDKLDEELPKIEKFIIFKDAKAIKLNWLRTVVRRAERRIVELNKQQPVNPKLLAYINRLSDYLFMIARKEETK